MKHPREVQVEDGKWIAKHLATLAQAIAKDQRKETPFVVAGIRSRGPALANRLCAMLQQKGYKQCQAGSVDVRFERDDIALRGPISGDGGTRMPAIHGITVVLVDDVLHTGRSARAALSEIMNFGRPAAIKLAVLIDRGGREMPIAADYVGARKEAGMSQKIVVKVKEQDGVDGVFLIDSRP
ncbi:MAG TPA: bifunctional pyr operon transcriptional regulator/uracil phosphoribosyltransferase PyrR [Planctomycetota bacterium]|nr:bifunctional pyr operon transcriptional regulator/uracil phosphoribosyltransferase PyrR [Planctomycetota bacterium]